LVWTRRRAAAAAAAAVPVSLLSLRLYTITAWLHTLGINQKKSLLKQNPITMLQH